MTEPNKAVRFRKGDPLCQIFPVRRCELEEFQPELRRLSDAPELAGYMDEWGDLRKRFNKALKDPESPESRLKWPGHYRRGTDLHGDKISPDNHRTRQRLKPFARIDTDPDGD